ncbi:hypothetical protein AALO_G00251970 [Alosa alosa]|uniref:KIAA1522 n=1 Tax=Alosa alosa TaxID=278164 RepID=A0AAV6FV97_9TELE|nr:hypothetical protein AALO_G00251970 [Alosa alosa]
MRAQERGGACVRLRRQEPVWSVTVWLLRQHLQALYRDDLALAHRAGPRASALQRPKSLAVPGLTSSSFLHEPLGPVMSISPQATYLSKIIPNAILPAAVDVIQIDRSRRNRGSMRAVSKSSLASASPPSSCRSGDDTQEPRSSASSHGSQSQSSETVVSKSSTVSSKGATPTPAECPKERGDLSMAHTSTRVALSSFCSESKGTSLRGPESRVTTVAEVVKDDDDDEDGENVRNSRAFTRSLSVMKTKQPPAPPRRTFSLHHEKVKRRSRELVEGKDSGNKEGGKGQNKPTEGNTSAVRAGSSDHSSSSSTVAEDSRLSSISSPQSPLVDQCETSSSSQQNASTAESKFDRTLSPSSGYSSQSGTPTLSQKEICPPSPEKQKPPKPERTSPSVSNSSSVACLSTGESDPVRRGSTPNTTPPQTLKAPLSTAPPHSAVNLRDLLNIPPPPKVKAPSPPPPETWAHNTRTFELLCGPPPDTRRLLQLQNQVQGVVNQTQSQEPPLQHHAAASHPKTPASGGDKNVSQVENQGSEKLKVKEEQVPVQTLNDRTTESAFEPLALSNGDAVVMLMRQRQESQDMAVHVKQRDSQDVHQREEACLQADKQKIPEMSNTGKGPTVPKKEPPPEEQEPLHTESVWPPPPPPLEDLPELVYEGQEELDFPPPPPPFSQQTLPELEGSQIEVNQENELEDLEASVADKCVELPSVQQNEELHPEEEILGNPVAALPTLPEAGKLKQTTMLTADQAVTDVQPGEHLPECFEAMGPLDLGSGTAPSNEFPQTLTEQPTLTPENQLLTQELPPLTQEIPPATQEIPPMTQEIPPATQEIPHLTQEIPPATQEIPPPAQETLIMTPEILSLAEDLPSLMQENLLLKQEIPTLIQELPPLTLESPTLIEDIPSPPQEAPPPPPSTNDSDPAPEPHRSGSAGLGPSTLLLAHVPTSSPPQSSQATVNFRRQSSQLSRESRSKELLLRKSASMPKEDANIPLVTPSLLQMVRLRSVGVGEDPGMAPSPDHTPKADSTQSQDQAVPQKLTSSDQTIPQKPTSSDQDVSQKLLSLDQAVSQKPTGSDQAVPQKPIRKSLSLRAGTPAVRTPGGPAAAPSLRLQEAIRLKTAAMTSRDGLPARLCLRSSMASLHSGDTSSPPGGDMHKSPASTASFIFSKSTKKVVIETTSAPEALTGLKQSLAAELRQASDEAKQVAANGTNKMAKLPPPVARKPPQHSTNATEKVTVTAATERSPWGGMQGSAAGAVAANGGTTMLEVASQQAQATDETDSAGGADRTNSIEVS